MYISSTLYKCNGTGRGPAVYPREGERSRKTMSKVAYYDDLEFPFCDDVIKYEKLAKIGQGTFG